MRKTIFLLLLSLSVYGIVNIKAQVRIGSDNPPHPAAVLDLTPDTEDAAGGFLLPRVHLDSVKHNGVFGSGVTLKRGLVVYNLNEDDDINRPKEGVYCYNGEKWLLISGNFQPEAVPLLTWYNTETGKNFIRNNCEVRDTGSVVPYIVPAIRHTSIISQADADAKALSEASVNGQAYANVHGKCIPISDTRADFSISITPLDKVLWLGRNGELGELRDITIRADSVEVDASGYKMEYVWYLKDEEQDYTVITDSPALTIPVEQQDKITRGKVYKLFCAVRVGENPVYETNLVDAGKVVYGIGAWIGHEKWLNVANANVGGDQSLTLDDQLVEDLSAYNHKVMGDRFQWGRVSDGHELMNSETYPNSIPWSKINNEGIPTIDAMGKFALGGGDWREYPSDMTSNELRKKWYWRTMEDPNVGVDPCSPAMDGFPGEWFVMTRPQWDSILANNHTELVRGVAIYPNGDSNNASFYLPMGSYRSGIDGHELKDIDGLKVEGTGLWLNSLTTDQSLEKAVRLYLDSTSSLSGIDSLNNGAVDGFRADGFPVRCVSE